MKVLLYAGLAIGVLTYSLWEQLPKGSFYIGNALFIFLVCLYLHLDEKSSFIKFLILCCSVNNLLDELIFDPLKLTLNEYVFFVMCCLFWTFKNKSHV